AQQRLWFIDQLEPGSSAYNIPSALRFDRALDPAVLAAAFGELVRRHGSLRTSFPSVAGEAVQRIAPPLAVPLPVVDLRRLSAVGRETEARRLTTAEAKRPFELAQGPVLRQGLVHLGNADWVLWVTVHHIASDGWSMGILKRELLALYETFAAGRPSPLEELPVQYADFAVWQRQLLSGEALAAEIEHWRGQLAGAPAVLELPLDRPRPSVLSYRGTWRASQLPEAVSLAVGALSRRQGTTLFMTLLAAFRALLSRWSGQSDICVGTPIAGRNRFETEDLIGFFVNTLVLRTRLDDDPSTLSLLARVREMALAAYAHQDLPFEKLVEEILPERSMSHSPLFQVMFTLNAANATGAAPSAAPESTEAAVGVAKAPAQTVKFELTLAVRQEGDHLRVVVDFSTDLFDTTTIDRMLGHYHNLVAEMVEALDRPLSALRLISETERAQILVEWGLGESLGGAASASWHGLFTSRLEQSPEAIAVVAGDELLSYRELDRRAANWGHQLAQMGAGPEVPVGVAVERSPAAIEALLGIFAVGGIYVPLDPSLPPARRDFILADAGVEILLTRTSQSETMRASWLGSEAGPRLGSGASARPKNTAYVIYTSGSSGQPKGVCVDYGSLARHLVSMQDVLQLDARDRVLQFSSLSFDASLEQILAPLGAGASLVLRQPELGVAEDVSRWIVEQGLSVVDLPPVLWADLAHAAARQPEILAGSRLRWVIVGGDVMPVAPLSSWWRGGSRAEILNAYGPTEAVITSTVYRITQASDGAREQQPIGRPLSGRAVYLQDRRGRTVPLGVNGELTVGGAGLAKGYLGRPALTAQAFVPDPRGGEPGSRLYRTGDLARFLPSGDLEFLGRIDQQVKVRGFRIELGEIEVALQALGEIHEAIVMVRESAAGDLGLVAYVVPEAQGEPDVADLRSAALRQALQASLPDYMVPSVFVTLDALPLTPNGKIDREALLAATADSGKRQRAPSTVAEEILCGIWSEVLDRETVGIDDDFFELGGHSLLATRVISRIRTVFQRELPVRALFEAPTVAKLAALIEGRLHEERGAERPGFERISRDGDLPLSFAQQRLWFIDQLEPGSWAYNMPSALRFDRVLDPAVLAAAFGELVRRHESLRTSFPSVAGEPTQRIASPAPVLLPVVDLEGLPEADRELETGRLTAAERVRPFDLVRGPVLRHGLLRLGSADWVLLVTMHHIASDGWSVDILTQELSTLYEAFTAGRPSPLEELPIQYADYAAWQRQWLAGEVLEAEIGHWRNELDGAPTVLELPLDRPRPARFSYRGGALSSRADSELSGALQALSRRSGTTLFMTLAAGFGALLQRHTGQDDLLVGVPVAQRERAEIEGLIGFFVNTLALRIELGGQPTWSALLDRVRTRSLTAYAHQGLPFERLVDELLLERDTRRAPLVQAVVQFFNAPPGTPVQAASAVSHVVTESRTAKFDLVLNLHETTGGLGARWLYNRDIFDAATIRRLSAGYSRLLRAFVEDSEAPVGAAPLLAPAECQQLLNELGGAPPEALETAVTELLPERFAAQAALRPEAIAVVCGARHLSYGELARRAAGLARQLTAQGAGPEVLVGLCLERTERIAIGILGVLATGAAYVPLDPSYPRERLEFTLTDAAAKIVVADPEHAERVAGDERTVVVLGEAAFSPDEAAFSPEAFSAPVVDAESAAYVIYTSGSTGRPKGVVITHAQVARLFGPALPGVDFGAEEVWTLFHSYAFDFSVWELWGALLGGGRLVVVPFDISRSPALFHDLLARERVSSLSQTPTAFDQLIAADGEPAASRLSLRRVYFGGEALEIGMLAPWFARHSDDSPQLVNLYGITETTVHASWRPLELDDERGVGSPIGGPLADLELHLLDRHGRLVPWGVSGEIHVGGMGLARGYLGRAALTASRFVPHPWSEVAGARLYRSGDLARRRSNGELETLGRIDRQVKLRGFRIELGEIEAALIAMPEVRAAVTGLDTSASEPRLVAWVVTTAPAAALKKAVAKVLPEYMVPAAIVVLDAMPLTPQGKLDRRALPRPEILRPESTDAFVAPHDALEIRLAELWGEVLGIERVGAEDNFFDLGGDSIRGAILINRLQAVLGAIVHVVAIFDAPTPAAMAALLRRDYTIEAAKLSADDLSVTSTQEDRIDRAQVARLRALIEPLPPAPEGSESEPLNKPAVFVLAPPRSGTTLLRVLLGGHPELFAPPELELLSWQTLGQRRAAFSGRDAFWREGLLRAVMESHGLDAAGASALVEDLEREDWSTRRLYGWLQAALGERLLVDKTPSYALDLSILERAESEFEGARYLHLVRHPGAMIHSFEAARLDQLFFRRQHPWSTRRLAELLWNVSHENVLRFLGRVSPERQLRVEFEELVQRPQAVLEEICDFLGVDFDPAMLEPYADAGARMTDGLHAASKMLGDVKFHQHRKINPATAESWRSSLDEAELGVPTWEMAARFGYAPRSDVAMPATDWHPTPAKRTGDLPLSFAQQRLWFIDQLEPQSTVYNMPLALRFARELDPSLLSAVFGELARRHESLRTSFPMVAGEPVQRIAPPAPVPMPVVDLGRLSEAGREQETLRLTAAEAARPFDLARGPVLRHGLLRLGRADWVLWMTMHHIASDGWSMGILTRELSALYEAFAAGRPSPLEKLPIQYADYAVWQRRWLSGEVLAAEIEHWRRQLAGAPAVLELPLDRPRPSVLSYQGTWRGLRLPEEVSQSLGALSRQQGTTLFMTLLAAFQALLSRWSGQSDICVGTPIAGRHRLETSDLIGFFVNTLVLRTRLDDDPDTLSLLARVREMTLEAYTHQDLPFEKLVEEILPERSLSHSPLFQVMFTFNNASNGAPEGSAAAVGMVPVSDRSVKFELTLAVRQEVDRLRVGVDFSTDLFDTTTIERMLDHYRNLLVDMVEAPARAVSALGLISASERAQLLTEWGLGESLDGAASISWRDLFDARLEHGPEAIAVVAGDEFLSYRELDLRATHWARQLAQLGAGPEVPVGVSVERSLAAIEALLAIFEVGGAYVPLDPALPAARRDFILADAGVEVFLTRASSRDAMRASRLGSEVEPRPDSGTAAARADNTAYVIYTSGSSGRPKGVCVDYGSLARHLISMQKVLQLGGSDRVLQFSSLGFDASLEQILVALAEGASLVLRQPELGVVEDVSRWIVERGLTVADLPPALWADLARTSAQRPEILAGSRLRSVIVGGDVMPAVPLAPWWRGGNSAEILNVYGPTEAVISSTAYRLTSTSSSAREQQPIGRPLSGRSVYLQDRQGRAVPLGVNGELVTGGVGLARGYLGQPALTAQVFVPDPWGPACGGRLYRTGDLARYLPNGDLEFLGRIDRQVKVRGFRIELGEIEIALQALAEVHSAVVMVRQGAS
ncbi:MAG: amino acid adenylation domain-containing protein, partial [Acidobacteriota bacterium]